MKKYILLSALSFFLLSSCNKDKEILNSLNDYNLSMESKGYHFGDKLSIPQNVLDNAESISINFGDKESSNLTITPEFFTLGDNPITFNIKTKGGEILTQDANINVFATTAEVNIPYEIVTTYPHDIKNFTQGFQLDGNTIYESDGQNGSSQILKYTLGSTTPIAATAQPAEYFSEGSTIVDDKVYQLTWQNKKGFIYDKASLKLQGEFPYPAEIGEGWGLTYDGKNLMLSDGTKRIFFLDPANPSKVLREIAVANNTKGYDKLNELEYHNGYIYANVWMEPIVLKIDPKTGASVGKFDFSEISKMHNKGNDDVLNGIAFKGDNMLVTGKNWPTIYEIKLK